MPGKRILVIGDVMLDRFVYGQTTRVSPEAPALVLAADRQEEMLGGAGNVALNLISLGAECTLIGLVGSDEISRQISAELDRHRGIVGKLVVDSTRTSTLKVRFINPQHNTHLLRLDWEAATPAGGSVLAELVSTAMACIPGADAVILSDYQKGVIQPALVSAVIEAARLHGIPVIVDPKGRDFSRYRGATAIAPNLNEISVALGRNIPQDDAAVEEAAAELSRASGIATVVVKRSQNGVQVVEDGRTIGLFAAVARRVVDVSGAGDTLVAALALSMAARADMLNAVRIANAAAGVVVSKKGTASVSWEELSQSLLGRRQHHVSPKVYSELADLKAQVEAWQDEGLAVGFTNGCFDLLHPGHIFTLTESRNRVDRLVLALNSDASVRRIKGPTRPVQNQDARVTVAAALEAVDAVILFDASTPIDVITALHPNVLFKGADYTIDQVIGREVVEAHGGRVELIEYLPDTSTTSLINRMAEVPPQLDLSLAGT
jgi:D-beta-D-heptose 7-phosphate kinase/D-beta-D-heptose 1-phosphate adenosyltransferase